MILFLISWILVGFISLVLVCIPDMRNKKFDEDYFYDSEWTPIVLILLGYISLIIVAVVYTTEYHVFAKLLYKISNIGAKTQEEDDKV